MESKKAEKGDESSEADVESGQSWWDSFYDSAKQKLAETNQFLVRDIKEFTETVKSDTSKLVANTAASMKDQLNIKVNLDEASNATRVVTNSISGFLGKVVQHVAPIPPDQDEDIDSTMFLGTSAGVKVMSPAEARLFSLQTSPATYCNEPDNSAQFEIWRESFSLDEKKEELSLLMLDSREVRTLYTKLVPEAVSHVDFWTRYFYKKHELEKAEERRAKLVERAQTSEADLEWGDEDEYDIIESSKEEVTPSSNLPNPSDRLTPDPAPPSNIAPNSETIENPTPVFSKIATQPSPPDPPSTSPLTNRCDSSLIDRDHVTESDQSSVTYPTNSQTSTNVSSQQGLNSSPQPHVECKAAPQPTAPEPLRSVPSSKGIESSSGADSSDTGIEPSSGADSSEWEKEFDLDMTEDEIIEALQEDNEDEIEGWEEWE